MTGPEPLALARERERLQVEIREIDRRLDDAGNEPQIARMMADALAAERGISDVIEEVHRLMAAEPKRRLGDVLVNGHYQQMDTTNGAAVP